MSGTSIRDEMLNLPAQERAKLIDDLWESLASEEIKLREAAWAAESDRRIDAFEAGQLQARDAQSVLSDLRKGLRR
jgi:putative addiction module component (TIGR02574 family)